MTALGAKGDAPARATVPNADESATAPNADESATAPNADESATALNAEESVTALNAEERTMFRFAEFVGRYRLVVSEALLEFIERAFVETAPTRERERVREEALEEARQSELCIDADGTVTSRARDREFYRVNVDVAGELDALRFEKAPGMPVTLVLVRPHRIVAYQPNKPVAEFHRIVGG